MTLPALHRRNAFTCLDNNNKNSRKYGSGTSRPLRDVLYLYILYRLKLANFLSVVICLMIIKFNTGLVALFVENFKVIACGDLRNGVFILHNYISILSLLRCMCQQAGIINKMSRALGEKLQKNFFYQGKGTGKNKARNEIWCECGCST